MAERGGMAPRLRWWMIPGACIVLLRVVTLEPAPRTERTPATPVAASVRVDAPTAPREATARRARIDADQVTTAAPFVLHLPEAVAGERVQVRLWRRTAGGREHTPWLEFTPRVRQDRAVPIAGLAEGAYDVEVVLPSGKALRASAVAAPGACEPAAASPLR
jgi:hypothetical protein